MTKRRCTFYRILTVFVALYGMMSVCICADHASSLVNKPVCCHCAGYATRVVGAQLGSYHQCCGMERAPIVSERVSSSDPVTMPEYALLHPSTLFSDTDIRIITLSPFSHAPPGGVPIYFTTQRFVI